MPGRLAPATSHGAYDRQSRTSGRSIVALSDSLKTGAEVLPRRSFFVLSLWGYTSSVSQAIVWDGQSVHARLAG